MVELLAFQKRFVTKATDPKIDLAVLSLARGNGKSSLAAHLLTRALTVGDSLNVPGAEYLLCAASIPQARLCFRFIRADLEPTGEYRFIDSATRIGIRHVKSGTTLRVLSSNGKTGMGIVGCPLLVADEPGSWEVNGGQLMADAIFTAQGKPGSPMRVVMIGTLAPAVSGWWHQLVQAGSHGGTYVQALQGDRSKWNTWKEVSRCNPLTKISPEFRKKLRQELAEAEADTRLAARFKSYRLNVPSGDESTMLLTIDDFEKVLQRPVAERVGKALVAVDLGENRAFSAAVAAWRSGVVAAIAVCPGIPDIPALEKRDRVASGTYQELVDAGTLRVAHGLEVPPVAMLIDHLTSEWGRPASIIADRHREGNLRDASQGISIEPRVTRWFEAASDIRDLRRLCKDGPFSLEESSRSLMAASLSVATIKSDDTGNSRLIKSSQNTARDDVAAAWLLVAGAYSRAMAKPKPKGVYRGKV